MFHQCIGFISGLRGGVRGGGRPPWLEKIRANSAFRASTSCSKVLKDKKYFHTVKNFMATLFYRAGKLFKNLNDKNWWRAARGGKERSSSPSIIMKCAKRIRDPKPRICSSDYGKTEIAGENAKRCSWYTTLKALKVGKTWLKVGNSKLASPPLCFRAPFLYIHHQ